MQASRTRDDIKHFDHFECQHCGTLITEAPAGAAPEEEQD